MYRERWHVSRYGDSAEMFGCLWLHITEEPQEEETFYDVPENALENQSDGGERFLVWVDMVYVYIPLKWSPDSKSYKVFHT